MTILFLDEQVSVGIRNSVFFRGSRAWLVDVAVTIANSGTEFLVRTFTMCTGMRRAELGPRGGGRTSAVYHTQGYEGYQCYASRAPTRCEVCQDSGGA